MAAQPPTVMQPKPVPSPEDAEDSKIERSDMMLKISLAAARVNAGLTQREVAETLGVSTKTVWQWENGVAVPSSKYLDPLCELYKLSYNHINFLSKGSV